MKEEPDAPHINETPERSDGVIMSFSDVSRGAVRLNPPDGRIWFP
jgi:hypothetical protein